MAQQKWRDVQGNIASTATIGVYLMRVRDVGPLVLLVKLVLDEGKMLGTEDAKDLTDYDWPEMYTKNPSPNRAVNELPLGYKNWSVNAV
jgi:hypothetical protein